MSSSPAAPLPNGQATVSDLQVFAEDGQTWARWGTARWRCAVGRGAIGRDKREGDGVTPVGRWPLRRVLYRADRLDPPRCALPCTAIALDDGWCDAPQDPAYNQPVRLPYPASHERMTRYDGLYDVVVVLGHNDDPVVPGAGSAIFLHVARDDYGPTEGCVALALGDLLTLLREAGPGSAVVVAPP
jgi:L,D-peptidoglycan transpeptidase YkuD (ErfK/YbiS/YcfS/YnhG family)